MKRPEDANKENTQAWPDTAGRTPRGQRKKVPLAASIPVHGQDRGFLPSTVGPWGIAGRVHLTQDTLRAEEANRLIHSAGVRAAKFPQGCLKHKLGFTLDVIHSS